MHFTYGNVGRLVFSEQSDFVAPSHLDRTFDYNQVLGAIVVFLYAQGGAGLDVDAFDLRSAQIIHCCRTNPMIDALRCSVTLPMASPIYGDMEFAVTSVKNGVQQSTKQSEVFPMSANPGCML